MKMEDKTNKQPEDEVYTMLLTKVLCHLKEHDMEDIVSKLSSETHLTHMGSYKCNVVRHIFRKAGKEGYDYMVNIEYQLFDGDCTYVKIFYHKENTDFYDVFEWIDDDIL